MLPLRIGQDPDCLLENGRPNMLFVPTANHSSSTASNFTATVVHGYM